MRRSEKTGTAIRLARAAGLLGLAVLTAGSPPLGADHGGGGGGGGGTYVPPPYVDPPPQDLRRARIHHGDEHEVWLVDQSNTNGLAFGGTLYIYDPAQLRRNAATAVPQVIDLGGATSALCLAQTGANPVRPHMLVFNVEDNTHAILSFVASGHVVFFDAATRTPLRCFRTEVGAGGVRQAHAIYPTPDDAYILVANQNGKKFERIATDYENNVFVQQPAATLDLAGCTTPNGFPCQDPALRPDNAPICPFVPESGFPAYVSLRGGGMLAIDPYATPMSIVAEYDATVIPRDGCGFAEARHWVYGNGGGGNVLNPDGWFLYRLPRGGRNLYKASNPPNTPEPEEISHDDSVPRDAHGVARTKQEKKVWFFDRAANVVEIYRAQNGHLIDTMNLATPQFSVDPTPDLAGESPDGKFFYVSLRGPNPLSGDPHASTGSTPGLMVLEVLDNGRFGAVRGIARINNIDAGGVQRADAHGIRVRHTGCGH
jgi:DNA-binding beta-propeller fold protein YncE